MIEETMDGAFPELVAKRESEWNRRHAIYRLRLSGLSLAKVAEIVGLSTGRTVQICARAQREHDHRGKMQTTRSPVENYLAEQKDVRELASLIKDRDLNIARAQREGREYEPRPNIHRKPRISD